MCTFLIGIPYLGYGSFSFTEGGDTDSQAGAILGGFGGIRISNLFFGLDYHTGGVYILPKHILEVTHQMFGAGMAYYGSSWRIWGGYYFDNQLEDDQKFIGYTGKGIKIGIGWTFKSKLSVNAEMLSLSWDEKLSFGTPAPLVDATSTQTYLSVSAPIQVF